MATKLDRGITFSKTGNGITSASVTLAKTANTEVFITDISGSSDLTGAVLTITSGGSTIWQDRISNNGVYQHSFMQGLCAGVTTDVVITVTGTSNCYVNMAGVTITNQ